MAGLELSVPQQARLNPAGAAVTDGEREIGYAALDAEASRMARRLAAGGVRRGDRVAALLPAGFDFVVLLHALPRLGAVLTPINPAESRRQLELAGARMVVEEPLTGEEEQVDLLTYADPDSVQAVIFTSGTTGEPRPVELTFGNHHASAVASAERLGVDPADRWLCPLPLFHVGGLAVLLRSAIYGTTAVVHDGFDTERVRAALESGDVSLASLVPTMLGRLREAGLAAAPALRAILLGGGPAPADLLDWADVAGLRVMPTYGMTETASQIATAGSGERAGRPLSGVELGIGEDDEILVRGPMVAPGALAPDGWLHTGDAGAIDADGLLQVHGRLKELIVTGGENVAPAEVEQVLLAHSAVADAAVVGRPDPEWGEAVSAFVVLDGRAEVDELTRWCRERLAGYKVPKRIETRPALPRNAAGKILRDRL
jgi:O-succinylbenzoic acid--CoA ligase